MAALAGAPPAWAVQCSCCWCPRQARPCIDPAPAPCLPTADPIEAAASQDRAQHGTFVSSRHALKAARLLAGLMAAPEIPREVLAQCVEFLPDLEAALEVRRAAAQGLQTNQPAAVLAGGRQPAPCSRPR